MPIQIGKEVLADFTDPITMLHDCHRRIESFLDALVTISRLQRGGALDERHRSALSTALRYFDQGAPLHTADEEESLFPRLRNSTAEEAMLVGECLSQLEVEHREKEWGHRIVHRLGTTWLEEGSLSMEDAQRLVNELERLDHTYRRHIRSEEDQVFPVASNVLPQEDLRAMGIEMKARRRLSR